MKISRTCRSAHSHLGRSRPESWRECFPKPLVLAMLGQPRSDRSLCFHTQSLVASGASYEIADLLLCPEPGQGSLDLLWRPDPYL